MQIPYAKLGLRLSRRNITFLCALAWLVAAAFVAGLPISSTGRGVTAVLVFCVASVFAVGAAGYAASAVSGKERFFWGLLGAGLLTRLGGYMSWFALRDSSAAAQDAALTQALYTLSYVILFAAMIYLAALTTRRLAWVTALDAVAIMFSFGSLVWFFALGPALAPAGLAEALGTLSRPAMDAAVLYVALVVLSSSHRPPWSGLLTAGFLSLLAAYAIYLGSLGGERGIGGWPEMFCGLGAALIGFGAVYSLHNAADFEPRQRIAPWRVFSFWFGPLSPAVHFALLLAWGIFQPPLPSYVLAVGVGLMAYFALRVSLLSYIQKHSEREEVIATRRYEQDRILQELHETVKQSVHGISLALDSASEAVRVGEASAVRDRIARARETAREAEYRISRPYDELRSKHETDDVPHPGSFLCYRLSRFEEYFGIKAHVDMQSPLEELCPEEMEVVNRIAVEAFWNVAKHSRARNLHLESRRVGRVLIVRIRDDGRGFDTARPGSGMGLLLMRRRAREVGAELDVISKPGVGTTVQLRFDRKSH